MLRDLDGPAHKRDLAVSRLWGAVQWIASADVPGVSPEARPARLREAVIECHAEIEAADAEARALNPTGSGPTGPNHEHGHRRTYA